MNAYSDDEYRNFAAGNAGSTRSDAAPLQGSQGLLVYVAAGKLPKDPVFLLLLRGHYLVHVATSPEKAMAFCLEQEVDLVLADCSGGGRHALEFVAWFKADPKLDETPIVVITDSENPQDQVHLLESGASDCLTVPVVPELLAARVRTQMRMKHAGDLLPHSGILDRLTGIYNRRSLDQRIDEEWRRAYRAKTTLGLILADVDAFGAYNEHYGPAAGDQCLREIACAFAGVIRRAGDLLARYGGGKFGILLCDNTQQGATIVAEKLQLAVATQKLEHQHSSVAPAVTLSFGLATGKPAEGGSLQDLLCQADQRLRQAKLQGRNRICA